MSSRTTSISFDRAADFYDKTRSFAPEAQAAVTNLLARELLGRRTLEIGVGTGRIALPLHERGIEMLGLDLSRPMMAKLIERSGGLPFSLLQGDAMHLPFRNDAVDAVVASWVLHLVADWKVVIAEMTRVARPGSVLLITEANASKRDDLHSRLTKHFRDVAGVTGWPKGPLSFDELDAEMSTGGATPRELETVWDTRTATIEALITAFEAGIFSVSWSLTPEQRKTAADQVREWARSEFGDLDEPRTIEAPQIWRAYDL